jgi:hypothetical protein
LIESNYRTDIGSTLVDKLQSDVFDTRFEPTSEMLGTFLCFGAKDGVATTHIGNHRVDTAVSIA